MLPASMKHKSYKLGVLIKQSREAKDMTQLELSRMLGLNTSVSVCRWEVGASPVPPEHYRQLSKILGIPFQTVLALASEDSPEAVDRYLTTQKRLGAKPSVGQADLVIMPPPDLLHELDELRMRYPKTTVPELIDAAIRYFLVAAQHGLDLNLQPIPPPGSAPNNPKSGGHSSAPDMTPSHIKAGGG